MWCRLFYGMKAIGLFLYRFGKMNISLPKPTWEG